MFFVVFLCATLAILLRATVHSLILRGLRAPRLAHQRIHATGEIVRGADLHIGSGGRFGGKVGGGLQIAVAGFWRHFVGDQNVATALDQVFFLEAQVGVAVTLVHGISPIE